MYVIFRWAAFILGLTAGLFISVFLRLVEYLEALERWRKKKMDNAVQIKPEFKLQDLEEQLHREKKRREFYKKAHARVELELERILWKQPAMLAVVEAAKQAIGSVHFSDCDCSLRVGAKNTKPQDCTGSFSLVLMGILRGELKRLESLEIGEA